MNKRTTLDVVDSLFKIVEANGEMSQYVLQQRLKTNPNSVKNHLELIRLIQSKPRLIVRNGKICLGEDWIDPLVREVLGDEPNPNHLLYIKLLGIGAISPENAKPLSELTPEEIQIVSESKKMEHVMVTEDLKVYLSKLGETLAKGAKKAYL